LLTRVVPDDRRLDINEKSLVGLTSAGASNPRPSEPGDTAAPFVSDPCSLAAEPGLLLRLENRSRAAALR
jgi:hypothetical protein